MVATRRIVIILTKMKLAATAATAQFVARDQRSLGLAAIIC
jgi:hypothetical protein